MKNSTKMSLRIDHICRSCMTESNEMQSIFNNDDNMEINFTLSAMIMACASVEISNNDGLPLLICKFCINELQTAFAFKQRCERSDATLREYLTKPIRKCDKYDDLIEDNCIEKIEESTIILESNILVVDQPTSSTRRINKKSRSEELKSSSQTSVLIGQNSTYEVLLKQNDSDELDVVDEIAEYIVHKDTVIKKRNLNGHHKNKQDYTCEVCQKSFNCAKYLTKHLKSHNCGYNCSYCSKTFKTQASCTSHQKIHTKIYHCNLCDKKFKSSHGLVYHIKRHKGIKDFKCPIAKCGKAFTIKQALNKHMTLHSCEKKHLCSECGKAYSTYDALSYHLKQHRGQRPYLCIHCGKTFKQLCHLKTHMWVHNGIKPYKCEICGIRYTTGHQLKRHRQGSCAKSRFKSRISVDDTLIEIFDGTDVKEEIIKSDPDEIEVIRIFE